MGAYLGSITKDYLSRFVEHEQLKQPGRVIGIYFIDRASGSRFSEKEIAWFQPIVIRMGQVFETSQRGK